MKMVIWYCFLTTVLTTLFAHPTDSYTDLIVNIYNRFASLYPVMKIGGGTVMVDIDDYLTLDHTSYLSTPEVAQAKYYSHFAAAAYCNDPQLAEWNCKDCLATGPDVQFVSELNEPPLSSRAYIIINHKAMEIILAYRGSLTARNSMAALQVQMLTIPGGNGIIQVHEGAWKILLTLHEQVVEILRPLVAKHSNYNVVVTGHSLGGMMASLALFKLKNTLEFSNVSYSLYTYGQPRTGNLEFARWFRSQKITGIRVVANADPFPHSLTLRSAGYIHHLPELWIHKEENRTCSKNKFEDSTCSDSLRPYFKLFDHLLYWDSRFPPVDCLQLNPFSYVRNFKDI